MNPLTDCYIVSKFYSQGFRGDGGGELVMDQIYQKTGMNPLTDCHIVSKFYSQGFSLPKIMVEAASPRNHSSEIWRYVGVTDF